MLMDDVYQAMLLHMATPPHTPDHLFICKCPAIKTAYKEYREQVLVYWCEARVSRVRNETDARLGIPKYKKNTLRRKGEAFTQTESKSFVSLRVLVSNPTIRH